MHIHVYNAWGEILEEAKNCRSLPLGMGSGFRVKYIRDLFMFV